MSTEADHDQEKKKIRVTIVLPPHLVDEAKPRWEALEYGGISAYIEQLIWQDLRDRPAHYRVREEPATPAEPEQNQQEQPPKHEERKPGDKRDRRIGFEDENEPMMYISPLWFVGGMLPFCCQ
jgi:hypothetical protein